MYYKKYHLLASVALIALGVGFSHGAVQAASGKIIGKILLPLMIIFSIRITGP